MRRRKAKAAPAVSPKRVSKLTKTERETIVRFSVDPADQMTLETFNANKAKRLIAAGATVKRHGNHGGFEFWTLEMPPEWFKWPRAPSKRRSEAARNRILAGKSQLHPAKSQPTPPPTPSDPSAA